MRTYELMFVVDPRVSDEEVVTMAQDYRNMITAGGSTITGEENWARRKRFWDLFIPADLQQQKVCDAFLFMALPLLFIRVPDAIPDSLFTALGFIIAPALLFQAIATRPLAWIRPSSRAAVRFGRVLFFGLFALVVSALAC